MDITTFADEVSAKNLSFFKKYKIEPNTILLNDNYFSIIVGTSWEKELLGLKVVLVPVDTLTVVLC